MPLFFGFAPTPEAWHRALKKIGAEPREYPSNDASVSRFENQGGDTVLLVTISDKFDARYLRDPGNIAGILAHEAMHVYQRALVEMHEAVASTEMEAYCVQFIVEQLFDAYLGTRIVKRKKRK